MPASCRRPIGRWSKPACVRAGCRRRWRPWPLRPADCPKPTASPRSPPSIRCWWFWWRGAGCCFLPACSRRGWRPCFWRSMCPANSSLPPWRGPGRAPGTGGRSFPWSCCCWWSLMVGCAPSDDEGRCGPKRLFGLGAVDGPDAPLLAHGHVPRSPRPAGRKRDAAAGGGGSGGRGLGRPADIAVGPTTGRRAPKRSDAAQSPARPALPPLIELAAAGCRP